MSNATRSMLHLNNFEQFDLRILRLSVLSRWGTTAHAMFLVGRLMLLTAGSDIFTRRKFTLHLTFIHLWIFWWKCGTATSVDDQRLFISTEDSMAISKTRLTKSLTIHFMAVDFWGSHNMLLLLHIAKILRGLFLRKSLRWNLQTNDNYQGTLNTIRHWIIFDFFSCWNDFQNLNQVQWSRFEWTWELVEKWWKFSIILRNFTWKENHLILHSWDCALPEVKLIADDTTNSLILALLKGNTNWFKSNNGVFDLQSVCRESVTLSAAELY